MSDNNWCRPPEDFHYFRQVGGGPCDCGIKLTAGLRMVTVERLATLEAAESRIDLLRRLLHREHFFEAGRLGFTPPLYGEPCPPCDAVKNELAALATVPSEPSGGAEGERHESWCPASGGECSCDAPEFGPND